MSTDNGVSIESDARGFAELMNNFNKLTEMESKIEAAIENAKVPWIETRKFLKGITLSQVLNTPLAQFIQDLFKEIGLGELKLSEKGNFRYIYRVRDSPICDLFKDIPDKKVCQPTTDAITRFFAEDLGLEGEVQETRCKNIGDEYCEFKMELQPFSVLEKALDKTDFILLKELIESEAIDLSKITENLQLDEDELRTRLTFLQYYELLNEDYRLSKVGETFYRYRSDTPFEEEKYFDPPWKTMAELTSTIAATQSFAEALVVVSEGEQLPWDVDEAELVDIKERAKDKASFAELFSAEAKEDFDKEGDEEDKERNEGND